MSNAATPPGSAEDAPAVLLDATRAGLAVITLNRPKQRNAFGPDLIIALSDIFETLHGADHVRTVLLRGAGGTFCAGADLAWMAETADWLEDDNREDAMRLAGMLKKLHDLPQLTVALVEGSAFGGGAGLVAACDYAIAAQDARFAFSEVRLGLTPATISPYVVRAIGPRNARQLFATGRVIGAQEAQGLGLVHEVVMQPDEFGARIEALAEAMSACAPGAVADAKVLVDTVYDRPLDRGLLEYTASAIAHRRACAEGREGVAAFLNKQKPSWAER